MQTSAINRDSGAFHGGNDYSVPIGTPIQSGASGTVIWSGYNPGGQGYAVVVKDANGNSMLYSHMGTAGNPPANMPAVGTEVKAGDTIGTVGNTGQVQISNGGGVLHVTAFDQTYTEQIRQSGASMSDPQTNSNSLGVSSNPKLSNGEPNKAGQGHILNPDAYMQDNPELFKPSDVSPVATTGASGDNTTNPNHTSDYNFSNTAGGGRGSVNPDGVQPSDSSPEPSDSDSDVSQQIKDAFNQADQSAADIKAKYPDSIQVADASGALPDTSAQTNTNTFSNYLDTQGSGLSAKQQDALAAQIDKLGLGGEAALSFYPLPTGSTVIANADGEIVGELNLSSTGDLSLKATAIDGNGNSVEVNNHISEQGNVITDAAQVQQQAANMFNSLMAANNWDHLSDVGKLSALVNLYNATDKLGEAFGATGDNLPGDLGAAAGYLQLAQGLQSGDNLIIANGLNTVSGGAVDQAIGSMVGQELPYVSTLLELRNFADNPEQAALTMTGTYVGEAFGTAIGGPIGAAIGGAIGGMIGGMVGSALGDDPPAPEGAAHFSWDANGHIQHTVDFSVSGGGEAASSVAVSLQNMLQSLVDAHNAQNASTADDIALNPYCLPTIHFKADWGGATVEIPTADGHVATQNLNSADFGQWLVQTIQDTGGLAPAWQVQTIQAHVQQQRAAGVDEVEIAREAGITATVGAHAGDAADSVQGNAVESADFKSQSFGALVVHLNDNPDVQAAQAQLSEVLRDVEGDGYLEKTQSVAARDGAGNLQAVLTLDFNGDGVIQTRDILNLGGNAAENLSAGGQQANANADLQRNNVQWLDANGDGVLDKTDPAFSAIRLWVDVNQDYVQQGNEASSLQSMHISSIKQAKRTGDWEGTAEQEAHRHGGGNVGGAPTETTATGATDFGPIKTQANQTTQSTVTVRDTRVVSAPDAANTPQYLQSA